MKRIRHCGWLLFVGLLLAAGHAEAAPPANPQLLFQFCVPHPPPDDCPYSTGYSPTSLVRGPDKAYYGVVGSGGDYPGNSHVFGLVYRIDPVTRIVSVVHRFNDDREGGAPRWLVAGADGNLYGYLIRGGMDGSNAPSIYRLSPGGGFRKVYRFDPADTSEYDPPPSLSRDGNLLGMSGYNSVSLYRLAMDGDFEFLHVFEDTITSFSRLTLAPDGYFYGVTTRADENEHGTIFRMGPDGAFETLHHFDGDLLDGGPYTGLTLGPDQALYGTIRTSDHEAMFRMTLDGQFTQMGAFGDVLDPNSHLHVGASQLTLMPDGHFYALRDRSGASGPYTEIFRLSLSGEYAQLYVFPKDGSMGYRPLAPLIRGFDNALYGTNSGGGKYEGGVVFRYVPPPAN